MSPTPPPDVRRDRSAPLAHVRAVVIDVDDTLYLERDYVRSGFDAVAEAAGLPDFAEVAWQLFLDGVRGDTFDRALDAVGPPSAAVSVADLVGRYRSHVPRIALEGDARVALDVMAAAGLHLAGVSDGPLESQAAKVTALGLDRWGVDVILTASYGPGFGKPHPRAFGEVAAVSGLAPAEHVYVADNPTKDFAGPHSLGWATVRVRRAGSLHEQIDTPAGVAAEIADLLGLLDLLGLPAA